MRGGPADAAAPVAAPPATVIEEPALATETAPLADARALLREHIAIDVHGHGGPTGVIARRPPGDDIPRGMRAGDVAAVCLADVPDLPLLERDARNVLVATRAAHPGELYRYHLDRLDWMDALTRQGVRRALTVADLRAAHAAGEPAMVMDIEGLDFLEQRLERLQESHRRGVRHMQLVHYTPNDIGDFQTGAIVHHGLTPFGADVIRACDRLGIVVDVAHATEAMVRQAVVVATRPLLLSHTALRGSRAQGPTPLAERQVSPDHARLVAQTGGAVGIWHFFPTFERWVDGLKEMADVVGVDHLCIGADHASRQGLLQGYEHFDRLVDAMLRGGFTPAETARIAGGNYLRIFAACAG